MYGLSDEDLALQARAATFAEELFPFEVEAEMAGGELPPDVVAGHAKRARELGLASTNMPRELGGGGCTTLQQVLVQEQMGRVTNALGWVAATPPSWLPPVATPYQIEHFLRPAVAGEREECYAITEEGAGSTWPPWRPPPAGTATSTCSTGSSGTSRRTTRPTSRSSRACWPAARTPASTRCSWWTCPAPG